MTLDVDDDVTWVTVVQQPGLYDVVFSKNGTTVRAKIGNGCPELARMVGQRIALRTHSPEGAIPSNVQLVFSASYGTEESCSVSQAQTVN